MPSSHSSFSTLAAASATATSKHDATQVELMRERIIRVNDQDEVLGSGSKEECHVNRGDDKIVLHRAFSVLLFDADTKRLLLQQRASCKITFPDYWANTCCSHPLFCEEEMDETQHLGVKRAAIRKLKHELGIEGLALKDFFYLGTIHYHAPGEGGWGEHEIDHVLGVEARNLSLDHVSANEVQTVAWFSPEELDEFVLRSTGESKRKISPWFKKMCEDDNLLPKWWRLVREGGMKMDALDTSIYKL